MQWFQHRGGVLYDGNAAPSASGTTAGQGRSLLGDLGVGATGGQSQWGAAQIHTWDPGGQQRTYITYNNIFIHIVYVWECNGFFLFYNQSHHHWLHPQAVLFKSYCLSPPQGTDFHPKYTGENLTCTVQGLKRSTQYKFRVSCGTIQMSFYFDLNTLSFHFKPRFSSDYCTTSELFSTWKCRYI